MNEKKLTDAMHRIEELYNETGGKCYVSFSGGKDSTVLLAIIKLCVDLYTLPPEGIKAVYCDTGIELGVTGDFVRWCKKSGWYSNIEIIRPEKTFDWVIKNKGKPIKSKLKAEYIERWHKGIRSRTVIQNLLEGKTNSGKDTWRLHLADKDMHMIHDDFPISITPSCCKELKKKPFKKYASENGLNGSILGLRKGEGGARELNMHIREKNSSFGVCTSIDKKGFIKKSPLVDWEESDIDEFIKEYNVPLSDAYTKYGFKRTGCMGCPFSRQLPTDLKYLFEHESSRYKASMHWLKDVYIAQNVILPFDQQYEYERIKTWDEVYEPMRQEMLRKYRPNSKLITDGTQLRLDL